MCFRGNHQNNTLRQIATVNGPFMADLTSRQFKVDLSIIEEGKWTMKPTFV
jgi:hypothetical protein